ncbi:MAG: hypothetical protein VYE73_16370 [Acidobacteriota bacterium]|nr:hypothetical protein [Acidobacteriota bacterium]
MKASRVGSSESRVWLLSHGGGTSVLTGCCVGLFWIYDPARSPALFFSLLLGWAAALALLLWRWRGTSPPVAAALIVAGLLRVLLLPLPLSLSDDAYRYLWDGSVVRAGVNPYAVAPNDESLTTLRDGVWERLPHRDVETVYPPLSLMLFSVAGLFPLPILALKLMLVCADLGCCWLLLRLAAARGLATVGVLAYAWNPLAVLETAGMGHVDALGLPLVVLATMILDSAYRSGGRAVLGLGPTLRAAALVAAAVLVKLVPVLVVPAFARLSGRRVAFVAAVSGIVAAAFVPFLVPLGGVPPGLVTYAVSWEFNGPLFEPLWRAVEVARIADGVSWVLDRVPRMGIDPGPLSGTYSLVYPQALAKGLLGLALIGVLVWSLRAASAIEACMRAFGGWVVVSATVHPWYLLWLLPWAAVLGRVPWLVLSASALCAYLPTLFGVALLPWPFLLVWIPPLTLAVWPRLRSAFG